MDRGSPDAVFYVIFGFAAAARHRARLSAAKPGLSARPAR
jgi:hypothetical protein